MQPIENPIFTVIAWRADDNFFDLVEVMMPGTKTISFTLTQKIFRNIHQVSYGGEGADRSLNESIKNW